MGQPHEARRDCHFVLRIKQGQDRTEGQGTTEGLGVQCGRATMTGDSNNGVQTGQGRKRMDTFKNSVCPMENTLESSHSGSWSVMWRQLCP